MAGTVPPSGASPAAWAWLADAFAPVAGEPGHRALYRTFQQGIRSGVLGPGTRLPTSRALAAALSIARNTVVHVYAQLALEGYVSAGVGRGTFVAEAVPSLLPGDAVHATQRSLLSRRGARLLDAAAASPLQWGAFMPGLPEVRLFPAAVWTRIQSRLWRSVTPPQLSYATGGGDAGLRYAIAEYLRSARGVQCTAEQIVVTSGTQQSLHLVAQLLADPGDEVWVEEPGYWGARNVFNALGLVTVPVRVDDEGLTPSPAQLHRPPRAMFVTPAHQYPTGVLMSHGRRRQLLDYATVRGVWVIEDDYDSEFRYASRPLPALQGQDTGGRVIYLGTFSKTLFPALRLAYVVLPPRLVEAFGRALNELYREGQTPLQGVLARFISDGHYASHVRRMRTVYGARHDALVEAIERHFGRTLPVLGSDAGLHLVLGLPPRVDDEALAHRIAQACVATRALSLYHQHRPSAARGLLLGYGGVDEAEIPRHFATLAKVLQSRT